MTRFNYWMAPLVAFAIAIGVSATSHAQQNDKQSDKKQEESSKESGTSQSNSQGSSQTSPANSGGQSGSQSNQSGTQSNQRSDSSADANKQQPNSQSNANQNKSDQDSKAQSQQGQSQSNQTQSNQRSQSDNRTGQSNAQNQGTNTRSNQTANQGAQNSQNNQNRDNQAGNRDNQNRDNRNERNNDRNNNQTNIAVGIQFGAVNDRGLVINSVQNNSFFYRAGFRQNDIIVSIGGQPIRNQAAFIEYVTVHRGERVPVIVLRDGRQETLYVEYTDADLVPPGQPGFGGDATVQLLGVTFDPQIPNAAVVHEVHPGGAAAAAGIKQGDEIVVINGQRVSGLQSVHQIVGTMKAGEKVEIDYLQLKHAQVTLADGGARAATGAAGVRVDQGVQQSNYQAGAAGVGVGVQAGQGSNNQGQSADRNQQNRNQNQNQNSSNRGGIIPRIR